MNDVIEIVLEGDHVADSDKSSVEWRVAMALEELLKI